MIREHPRQEFPKKQEKRYQENTNKPDRNRTTKRVKCYNCKQYGHFQTECIVASVLLILGHTAKNCFKNKAMQRKTLLCNSQASLENSGYYVTYSINGHDTRSLTLATQ